MNKPTAIGVALTETLKQLQPKKHRSMGGARRALEYRRDDGVRCQRCSLCHGEFPINRPIIYNLSGESAEHQALQPIMIGTLLVGFSCSECTLTCAAAIVAAFPNSCGLPLVDHHHRLVAHPTCEDCGAGLVYANDGSAATGGQPGTRVVCPACDTILDVSHEESNG